MPVIAARSLSGNRQPPGGIVAANTPPEPLHVAAGVLRRQNQVLISQRRSRDPYAGLWEFPGGKLEPGETAREALHRELKEELGVTIGTVMPLIRLYYRYPQRTVVLHVFDVLEFTGTAEGLEGQVVSWQNPEELPKLPFLPANQAIVKAVLLPHEYASSCASRTGVTVALHDLDKAIKNGLRMLLVREPVMTTSKLLDYYCHCQQRCQSAGVKLLVSGHPGRAVRWRADGVHLNRTQLFSLSRRPLPGHMLVAACCHNLRDLQQARRINADFAVLSLEKKTADTATPSIRKKYADLCQQAKLAVYVCCDRSHRDVVTIRELGAQGLMMPVNTWSCT